MIYQCGHKPDTKYIGARLCFPQQSFYVFLSMDLYVVDLILFEKKIYTRLKLFLNHGKFTLSGILNMI